MADLLDTSRGLSIDRSVVVIGAGTMGSGIAEVAATAGHHVYLRDTSEAALERGIDQIRKGLDRRVQRGRLEAETAGEILSRIDPVDAAVPLLNVGLVIEVIVENLEVKVSVLTEIESQVAPDAIIATNTSSLSVTAIAGRLARPDRVVGMHFFNPATILPLVEVVKGRSSDAEVVRTIVETAKAWGKAPVVCSSTPGFIVNRVARPYYGEALRLLQEQAASPATIDAVMRESGGFRMGPCELMDLIGHDVNFAVTRSVYQGFFDDARYKPSLIQKDLVDAGWLGRKSGRGFFDYRDGAVAAVAEDVGSSQSLPQGIRIEGDLGAASGLAELIGRQSGIPSGRHAGAGLIRVDDVVLALSDGRTATERSAELGESVVLFDLALDYAACSRVAIAASLQTSDEQLDKVIALFVALGKKVSILADVPGLAVTRTVAMLVNESADAVYQGIASADDVDAAMQKGVNYPIGPMAWGRQIGLAYVARVLRNLAAAYAEDRYRVSLWLQRAVHASQTGAS